MTGKAPMDLDEALEALARAERAAWPEVSGQLRARVLSDAAQVAAERRPAEAPRLRRKGGRPGLLDRLRGLDLWVGGAVAAVLLSLAIGFGVGYESGGNFLARTVLGNSVQTSQLSGGDPLFFSDDVL